MYTTINTYTSHIYSNNFYCQQFPLTLSKILPDPSAFSVFPFNQYVFPVYSPNPIFKRSWALLNVKLDHGKICFE